MPYAYPKERSASFVLVGSIMVMTCMLTSLIVRSSFKGKKYRTYYSS